MPHALSVAREAVNHPLIKRNAACLGRERKKIQTETMQCKCAALLARHQGREAEMETSVHQQRFAGDMT